MWGSWKLGRGLAWQPASPERLSYVAALVMSCYGNLARPAWGIRARATGTPREWLCCATVGDRRSRRFVEGWVALQDVTPAFVHTDDDGLSSPAAVFPLSATEQREKVDSGYRQPVASLWLLHSLPSISQSQWTWPVSLLHTWWGLAADRFP